MPHTVTTHDCKCFVTDPPISSLLRYPLLMVRHCLLHIRVFFLHDLIQQSPLLHNLIHYLVPRVHIPKLQYFSISQLSIINASSYFTLFVHQSIILGGRLGQAMGVGIFTVWITCPCFHRSVYLSLSLPLFYFQLMAS